ncbi:unnamed protein product, partial [Polarella glacialis]
ACSPIMDNCLVAVSDSHIEGTVSRCFALRLAIKGNSACHPQGGVAEEAEQEPTYALTLRSFVDVDFFAYNSWSLEWGCGPGSFFFLTACFLHFLLYSAAALALLAFGFYGILALLPWTLPQSRASALLLTSGALGLKILASAV